MLEIESVAGHLRTVVAHQWLPLVTHAQLNESNFEGILYSDISYNFLRLTLSKH
jgi:hypothetical protein